MKRNLQIQGIKPTTQRDNECTFILKVLSHEEVLILFKWYIIYNYKQLRKSVTAWECMILSPANIQPIKQY
jgi:hypothetical protein